MSEAFRDWKDAHDHATKQARRSGLDCAIRKAYAYGTTVYCVSYASRNDSDYDRAEIITYRDTI